MNVSSFSLSKEMIESAFAAKKNGPKKPFPSNDTLKCTKCDYKTVKKNYLYSHTSSKHPKSKIKCTKCDVTCAFPSKIKQHEKIVHMGIKRNNRYKCMIQSCQNFGKYTCEDLMLHSLLFCKQCDYSAKTKDEMKIHFQGVHEGIVYPCEQCSYVSKRKRDLVRHVMFKHTETFFGCGEENCSYETYSRNVLKKHIESEHEGIVHPCTICGQIFRSRDSFRKHILHEHRIKPFENGF